MSLMLYMKDLQRDLDEEGIELLVKKEKNMEGFSNILDHLHQTFFTLLGLYLVLRKIPTTSILLPLTQIS